ncbi:hypothetical protein AAVH_35724, partial [Aphelenchoides avenae]
FGSFHARKTPFLLAYHTDLPLNPRWPSDGSFGLGVNNGNDFCTVEEMLYDFETRQIALWLSGAPRNLSAPVAGGQITFGGNDTKNCETEWALYVAYEDNWSLFLDG